MYGAVISLRNFLYDLNILPAKKVDAFVISVGNLSTGGTGKTPMVLSLIESLSSREKKTAVLSRGYGRAGSGPKFYGPSTPIGDWRESGDEPLLIKNRISAVTLVIDSVRYRGAATAVAEGRCEIIILDDCFQHRGIHRDLDIVIVDTDEKLKNRLLLPIGRLREPLNSLRRADVVVVMGEETEAKSFRKYLRKDAVLCGGLKEADKIINIRTGEEIDLSRLKRTGITAFCGIGNPEGFRDLLNSFQPKNLSFLPFPDHHIYTASDFDKIRSQHAASNSQLLLTTEKDSIKLPSNFLDETDVYFLRIKFSLTWGKESFDTLLNNVLLSSEL